MVLLGGLWLFVFNDGALCWGFPHFLPLIVLIPRGTGGLGPDWVGYTAPAKLQMISQIHHACLQIGNRPARALCGFNKARAGALKSLQKLKVRR